ncbi:hypothetical protein VTP01DRAFT_1847 [Rhizomucor pusillus]|uniref:uncharacterized protein n=1 Tax=Rhizomucor pusillus TaxID=4840 RepID=UPI003742D518
MIEKKSTEKSASKKAEHPPYETMIKSAILALKERKGSSRQAIKKYILANYNVSARAHFDQQVSAAIKRGAAKNLFTLPKGLSGTVKLSKPEKKVATDKKEKKEAKPGAAEKKATTKKTVSAAKKTPTSRKTATAKKAAAVSSAKKQPTRQKTATKEKVKAPTKKAAGTSSATPITSKASPAGTTSRRRAAVKA